MPARNRPFLSYLLGTTARTEATFLFLECMFEVLLARVPLRSRQETSMAVYQNVNPNQPAGLGGGLGSLSWLCLKSTKYHTIINAIHEPF
jgi:hypothetical protein